MTKKFIPLAKKVIDLEIQALQKLKKKIDTSFNRAVVEIAKCKSKVILCGVGKSGLIAAKISETLSSAFKTFKDKDKKINIKKKILHKFIKMLCLS